MGKSEFWQETKKMAIEAVYQFFFPVIWLGRKIRDAWDYFTYRAGW